MSEDITEQVSEDIATPLFQRTSDRVCIVGFAEGHRADAPFLDDDIELWGINTLHKVLPGKRWDRWFEIHDLAKFYSDDEEHRKFLADAAFPIYVRGQDLAVAAEWGIDAVAYPRDQILAQFQPYFNNTVSWLLAMAIMMGFKEIQIYGVDMAQDNVMHAEYSEQRPSCEWLLGIAQGQGIRVVIPPGSDLLKASHLYGFDDDAHRAKLLARSRELGERKEKIRQELTQHAGRVDWLQSRLSEMDGSMQELNYQLKNLVTLEASNAVRE